MTNTTTPTSNYPVEVFSDDETCRYKIWDSKSESYIVRTGKHYWHWVAEGKKLTNRLRCGTCGHIKTIPEMERSLPIPNSHTPAYHATRTEQEP